MNAKRLLGIAAAMIIASFAANAQNYNSYSTGGNVYLLPGYMCHHGGNFYVDGIRVPEQELIHYFGDYNYRETYEGARRQRKAGNVLISVGVPVTVLGFVAALGGSAEGNDALYSLGIVGAVAGAACVDIGIPLLAVGNGRMNWLAEDYNRYASQYLGYRKPTLNLTGSRHGAGLGLALRF